VQATAPGRSYANATKKPSANNATPAQVVGGLSHAKADSISPVNGKNTIPPAVPTLGTPTIVNGNNAMNAASDHSRKVSVTINAQGASGHMPNGGPSVGKPAGIRFGSASPAMAHSIVQPSDNLAVAGNPRITSPATSPSPIPQPPASGGRIPSGLQGQGTTLNFGSMGGEDPTVS
jgi:translation initiation factor 4G